MAKLIRKIIGILLILGGIAVAVLIALDMIYKPQKWDIMTYMLLGGVIFPIIIFSLIGFGVFLFIYKKEINTPSINNPHNPMICNN